VHWSAAADVVDVCVMGVCGVFIFSLVQCAAGDCRWLLVAVCVCLCVPVHVLSVPVCVGVRGSAAGVVVDVCVMGVCGVVLQFFFFGAVRCR
jgi:hypothetical protein